jgi:hypothetical protein
MTDLAEEMHGRSAVGRSTPRMAASGSSRPASAPGEQHLKLSEAAPSWDPDAHQERYVMWFPLKSWLARLLEGWRVDPLSSYSHHDRYSVLLWRPDEP